MSLMNALYPWFGNHVEQGKKAQEEMLKRHYHDSSQVRMCHSGTIKFDRNIDGEFSVVEIDGKKLLEEIK